MSAIAKTSVRRIAQTARRQINGELLESYQIISEDDPLWSQAWAVLRDNFDEDGLASEEWLKGKVFEPNSLYFLIVVVVVATKRVIFAYTLSRFADTTWGLHDFMATAKDKQFQQLTLGILTQTDLWLDVYEQTGITMAFSEIEHPETAATEAEYRERVRRLRFLLFIGWLPLDFEYLQPSCVAGKPPKKAVLAAWCPDGPLSLNRLSVQRLLRFLYAQSDYVAAGVNDALEPYRSSIAGVPSVVHAKPMDLAAVTPKYRRVTATKAAGMLPSRL